MLRTAPLLLLAAATIVFVCSVSASTTVFLSAYSLRDQRAVASERVHEDIAEALEQYRASAVATEETLVEKGIVHAAAPFVRSDSRRGIYLKADSVADESLLLSTIDRFIAAGGSAIVFDVKGAYVYFDTSSSIAEQYKLRRPLYELPLVISLAKQKGLYTVARLVAANDPVFGAREPEVRIRHPQTNVAVGSTWVDLGNPTVLEYNRQVIRDLAVAGVDEINIDYIRYPTEYAQWQIGLTREEKVEHIEKFVRMARATINEFGPSTKLGLSTYAILGWHYDVHVNILGQDVVRFAPLLDVISPMAYPSTFKEGAYYNPAEHPGSREYYLVYRTLKGYQELLGEEHAHKLRPWIQAYYMTNQNLRDEMDAVYDAGACGFTFWSAGNRYDHVYGVLDDTEVPEQCR